MKTRNTLRNWTVSVGVLSLVLLIGCGGDGNNSDRDNGSFGNGLTFNSSGLNCGDTLDITSSRGAFMSGSTVTFKNQVTDASFDGSAVPIENGTVLTCGLPNNAPAGDYGVYLNGTKIGIINNLCPAS